MFSYFDLLSGDPLCLPGVGTLRPISLGYLRPHSGIGLEKYRFYINTLALDIEALQKVTNRDQDGTEDDNVPIFSIIVSNELMRDLLHEIISFFICEKVEYNPELMVFEIKNEEETVGFIGIDNYEEFCDAVFVMSGIKQTSKKKMHFATDEARKIYEKIQNHKKKQQKPKAEEDDLGNLISGLCSMSPYTYFNIWNLTLYQFYDVFKRMNIDISSFINALKWGAWGDKPFDYSFWYKNFEKIKEENNV